MKTLTITSYPENLNVYEARIKIKELLQGTPGVLGYGADPKGDTIVIYVANNNVKSICENKLSYLGDVFFNRFTRKYYIENEPIHFS